LITLQGEIIVFDFMKELYKKDEDLEKNLRKVFDRAARERLPYYGQFSFQRKSAMYSKDFLVGEGH